MEVQYKPITTIVYEAIKNTENRCIIALVNYIGNTNKVIIYGALRRLIDTKKIIEVGKRKSKHNNRMSMHYCVYETHDAIKWHEVPNTNGLLLVNEHGQVKFTGRYYCDKAGKIGSLRQRILRHHLNTTGKAYVMYEINYVPIRHKVEDIMKSVFNIEGKGEYICYKDKNYLNLSLNNLYYGNDIGNGLNVGIIKTHHGYKARTTVNRKRITIGTYSTPQEAEEAWYQYIIAKD